MGVPCPQCQQHGPALQRSLRPVWVPLDAHPGGVLIGDHCLQRFDGPAASFAHRFHIGLHRRLWGWHLLWSQRRAPEDPCVPFLWRASRNPAAFSGTTSWATPSASPAPCPGPGDLRNLSWLRPVTALKPFIDTMPAFPMPVELLWSPCSSFAGWKHWQPSPPTSARSGRICRSVVVLEHLYGMPTSLPWPRTCTGSRTGSLLLPSVPPGRSCMDHPCTAACSSRRVSCATAAASLTSMRSGPWLGGHLGIRIALLGTANAHLVWWMGSRSSSTRFGVLRNDNTRHWGPPSPTPCHLCLPRSPLRHLLHAALSGTDGTWGISPTRGRRWCAAILCAHGCGRGNSLHFSGGLLWSSVSRIRLLSSSRSRLVCCDCPIGEQCLDLCFPHPHAEPAIHVPLDFLVRLLRHLRDTAVILHLELGFHFWRLHSTFLSVIDFWKDSALLHLHGHSKRVAILWSTLWLQCPGRLRIVAKRSRVWDWAATWTLSPPSRSSPPSLPHASPSQAPWSTLLLPSHRVCILPSHRSWRLQELLDVRWSTSAASSPPWMGFSCPPNTSRSPLLSSPSWTNRQLLVVSRPSHSPWTKLSSIGLMFLCLDCSLSASSPWTPATSSADATPRSAWPSPCASTTPAAASVWTPGPLA